MKRWPIAMLLVALAAPAQQAEPPPPPPSKAIPAKSKPLSAEDAAIVKELALLEKVDLLRDLELFEAKDRDAARASKEPAQREP
jgi:hypothetical protein